MMRRCLPTLLLCLLAFTARADDALTLPEVVRSVTAQHPLYLIALMERDIAAGRLRQAQGAFDLNFLARGSFNPEGYYDGRSGDFVFDQPLPFWGGNVFAGYRISSGTLADYDKARTQTDGELRAGLRLNLLRDGPIDRRRADLWKSRLDQELADPVIARQRLDLLRNATRSYVNWVAMGQRWAVADHLLRIAKDRNAGIAELVQKGQLAPIVKVDNDRLVVSRELGVVQAKRRFEAASIELSLFVRDAEGRTRVLTRHELPKTFPSVPEVSEKDVGPHITRALSQRPELRRIQLVSQKLGIDQRLARNGLLPHLDFSASIAEPLGSTPYKDRKQTEALVGIELRVPLQRNEAKGRLDVVTTEMQRLDADAKFARERIVAELRDAYSAIIAAREQIQQTGKNVDLSEQMEAAERKLFTEGATDLLALQIREQATFDAQLLAVDAEADLHRAHADYAAALGGPLVRE